MGEIGSGVFREDPRRATVEVMRDRCGGIATPAIQPIQFAAVGAELYGAGRRRIVRADSGVEVPFTVCAALQVLDIAVVAMTNSVAHTELLIGEVRGETLVGLEQSAFPGRNIHTIDVEVTLIALVVRDKQFAGKVARTLLNVASHPGSRSQRPDFGSSEIDSPGAPVLVASLLAEEYDMPIVVHPYDQAEITVGHRSHRMRIVDLVDGSNPKIGHAIYRREEGNPRAIWTYAHDASFGISEDYAARKQSRTFISSPQSRLRRRRGLDRLCHSSSILDASSDSMNVMVVMSPRSGNVLAIEYSASEIYHLSTSRKFTRPSTAGMTRKRQQTKENILAEPMHALPR